LEDFWEVVKIVWIVRWGFFIGNSDSSDGSKFLLWSLFFHFGLLLLLFLFL